MRSGVDWITIKCSDCGGWGMRTGGEGEPVDCGTCGGAGSEWLSEHDRVAAWPGGPFRGSAPGAWNDTLAKYQYIEVRSPSGRRRGA